MGKSGIFNIGELARKEGISAQTLRYYERRGLIVPSGRTRSNYRVYDHFVARKLRFIRRAQALGFSLTEITELLSLYARPEADMMEVKSLTQIKITEIGRKIVDLERMRKELELLTQTCPGQGSAQDCPILAVLASEES